MKQDIDDTFQTWVMFSRGKPVRIKYISCRAQKHLIMTHTSPLHCSQLILREINVGPCWYQAPLFGIPVGSHSLPIYKDTNAALSPKMGRSRTYPPDYVTTPAAEDV